MTEEIKEKIIAKTLESPALKWQSNKKERCAYPPRYRGRVPTVRPDLLEFSGILNIKKDTVCLKNNEYFVWVNSYGAVAAILENGETLGLLPSEFDVTEWHENNK